MKRMTPLVLALLLAACALPETTVKTGTARPALAIKGAPADAVLFVDGMVMGPAAQYDGAPQVLIVEEGTHQVEVRHGNVVVHAEKVFVSNGETRTVSLGRGTP